MPVRPGWVRSAGQWPGPACASARLPAPVAPTRWRVCSHPAAPERPVCRERAAITREKKTTKMGTRRHHEWSRNSWRAGNNEGVKQQRETIFWKRDTHRNVADTVEANKGQMVAIELRLGLQADLSHLLHLAKMAKVQRLDVERPRRHLRHQRVPLNPLIDR